MRQTWRVVLERLRVNIPDEDGFASDGDEPQLAVIVFKSTYRRPGSTKVWRQPFDSSLWPEGVGRGTTIDIPASVGTFEYPPISSPWELGSDAEIFGFSVGAFERDATPKALIRDKLDDLVEALQGGLADLVEVGQLSLRPEEQQEQIDELKAKLAEVAEFSWIEEGGVFVGSAFDSDENIGSAQLIFTNKMDAGAAEFAVPRSLSLDFVRTKRHPFFPEMEIVTASYTVTGRIEIAAEELEFIPDTGDPECRRLAWSSVTLPDLVQAVKNGKPTQIEVKLDDTINPTRTAFGNDLVYHSGEDRPGNGPFIPAGHYGEKITMNSVECDQGRRSDHQWRAQLLLSPDTDSAFGSSSYPSILIYIDDVNVYYQPLQQVGPHWEGSDPSSRIQVFCRRYDPPH